jgi:hypothetical protein
LFAVPLLAERQQLLHERFASLPRDAQLSPSFRPKLLERIAGKREDNVRSWPDFLPDVAHLMGGAAATVTSVFLLPLPSTWVLCGGAACVILTYVFQSMLREALETSQQ